MTTAGVPDDCQKQAIAEKISRYQTMPMEALRQAWRDAHGQVPPKAFGRSLLVLSLAWRIQEAAFGGHDKAVLKILDAYAAGKVPELPLHRRLKAGTVLVREYQGERHTVTITPAGYVWRDQTYPSLSVIAQAITGTRWNGPRFFGLREGSGAPRKALGSPASNQTAPRRTGGAP